MDKLPRSVFDRVSEAVLKLEKAPRRRGTKKLRGRDAYRLRVGDYRVIYTVDDDARRVTIVGVGHRRDVYR
ncbi:MAG: type II toxin-antitoxin system RelE/ParE family toxin [Planctomycetota bacterium]